eukprot:UN00144
MSGKHMTNVGRSISSGSSNRIRVQEYSCGRWVTKEYDATELRTHKVTSYHVSCKSDKIKSWKGYEDLSGIVLYLKDGKTDWRCNDVHCKIGYIIIKKTSNLAYESSKWGIVHGKVYKSVFEREPSNVVASGFSYDANTKTWKWRSGVFNRNDIKAEFGDFPTMFGNDDIDKENGSNRN